jgi:hypothetical protein
MAGNVVTPCNSAIESTGRLPTTVKPVYNEAITELNIFSVQRGFRLIEAILDNKIFPLYTIYVSDHNCMLMLHVFHTTVTDLYASSFNLPLFK